MRRGSEVGGQERPEVGGQRSEISRTATTELATDPHGYTQTTTDFYPSDPLG